MIKHTKMINLCYEVFPNKQEIALHFPSLFSTWVTMCNPKRLRKRGAVLAEIRKESYYVADNVLRRVHGKPMRTLVLSTDPKNNPPQQLVNFIKGPPKATAAGLCSCSSWDLFQLGCKCGGN